MFHLSTMIKASAASKPTVKKCLREVIFPGKQIICALGTTNVMNNLEKN
jgi:hypothetical protein